MNKEKAIKWLQDNLRGWWPKRANGPFLEGWKWVILHEPYCVPEVILEHTGKNENIKRSDITV